MTIDTTKLKGISAEAVYLYVHTRRIPDGADPDRNYLEVDYLTIRTIAQQFLDQQEKIERLEEAVEKIERKTKKIIEHPPSPDPTLPIMLANALVAVNKIASAARQGERE